MATDKSNDVESLQHALERLGSGLHILDAFNHRNKNQHHSSRWWAQFNMLRRSVRKIIPELEAAVESLRRKPPVKRFKITKDGVGSVPSKALYARAQWLHEHAAPRAFVAFTQLAADNQYAPLGLVLLGVLAQIEAALSPLVQAEGVAVTTEAKAEARAATAEAPPAFTKGEVSAKESHDFGVAISRDEVLGPSEAKRRPVPVDQKRASAVASTSDKPPQIMAEDRKEAAKAKKDKKKKRKRKGDEFDDLFSSLV